MGDFPANGRISYERIAALLYVDVAGVLRWKVSRGTAKAGREAGSPDSSGYLQVKIDRQTYLIARIVWLLTRGEWPEHEVDHKDRTLRHNAPDNLRAATRGQQAANKPRYRNNTSGAKGVHRDNRSGRWNVRIQVAGRRIYLGSFDNLDSATKAYDVAARQHFGEFAATNQREIPHG